MALGAVGAHLAAVNIRVAIRAILAHVGEDGFRVAFRAAHFFMHSAKRITRGVVIEFGDGANRGPACAGMAVLARNGQRPVRTPARLLLGIGRANEGKRQKNQSDPAAYLEYSENKCPLTCVSWCLCAG